MKLLRLKLLTDFRGLQKGFEITFSNPSKTDKIDPICFVGPNGGGKSNVLELLSEIFYYLDYVHLGYSEEKSLITQDFGFEIEYIRKQPDNKTTQILIVKTEKGKAEFYLREYVGYEKLTFENQPERIVPAKIIGYSSGMNELISNPFIKMQFHYFNEYEKEVAEEIFSRTIYTRLLYMDYNSNSAIMISNYLLNEKNKLNVLCDHLGFKDLISFRISIRFKDYNKKPITLKPDLKNQIDYLKKCATCFNDQTDTKENHLTLDYFVTEETKKAFKHYFKTPFQLFQVFYLLDLLNIHMIQPRWRAKIRNAGREVNISAQIPKPPPDQFVFRIEQVRLKKEGVETPIPYKSISDGEHQFMHVVGTAMMMDENDVLFLLDEPETHFNPEWRSKLVNTLNKITHPEDEKPKEQEFIITTHSPFILSDCRTHNVFVFERDNNDKVVWRKLDIQTYGASSSVLLAEAFNKEATISDMAYADLQKLMKKDVTSPEDIEEIKREARKLGESAEKFQLFSHLSKKKKEMT